MSSRRQSASFGECVEEVAALLAGVGILTFTLAPFAIPIIVLTAVAAIPLVAAGLAASLVAGVVATPILVVRSRRRNRVAVSQLAARTGQARSTNLRAGSSSRAVLSH
jgi:uncharacterized membrane protein